MTVNNEGMRLLDFIDDAFLFAKRNSHLSEMLCDYEDAFVKQTESISATAIKKAFLKKYFDALTMMGKHPDFEESEKFLFRFE